MKTEAEIRKLRDELRSLCLTDDEVAILMEHSECDGMMQLSTRLIIDHLCWVLDEPGDTVPDMDSHVAELFEGAEEIRIQP